MLFVDHQTSFGGNVLQCPAQVDGIQAKLGEWICLVFQLSGWICLVFQLGGWICLVFHLLVLPSAPRESTQFADHAPPRVRPATFHENLQPTWPLVPGRAHTTAGYRQA